MAEFAQKRENSAITTLALGAKLCKAHICNIFAQCKFFATLFFRSVYIYLTNDSKPSGLVWVQFDCDDVGKKTRQENRNLYTEGISNSWTVKQVTTQFAVGKTKSAPVVKKQFPLRPASAKTVHRSQGDTQSQIVVNLNTRRAIPHIHYVASSNND